MTEYDYSPEAYERYLSTQRRIANWVDRTENCRPQFANALAPPKDYMPGGSDRPKHPARRLQRRQSHHHFRSRSPSIDSSSDESEYEIVPSPMPPMRSAPGHLGGSFPAHQLPWNQVPQPMVSPQRTMPPSYYGAPNYHDLKHRRTHSQSHGVHRQPQHYPAPHVVYASPPVSPGVYGYPGHNPQGYVMMPQQHGRGMPYMYMPPPC